MQPLGICVTGFGGVEVRNRPALVITLEAALLAVGLLMLTLIGDWAVSIYTKSGNVDMPDGSAPLIVIDAGHGGMDGGAVGVNGIVEAPLNLAVAKLVQKGLQDRGYRVKMTREDDNALGKSKSADMQMRRKIMRTEGVSAVVSIHMNKFRDCAVKGPRAFFMQGSKRGEFLATIVLTAVCEAMEHPRRIVATENYFVLRESLAPAVLVECGFLSNPTDAKNMQDPVYQQKLADGIVAGVVIYFASMPVLEEE